MSDANRTGVLASIGAAPRPRVLLLTHRTPYPPDRGDRIRSYHLLRELSRHFDVSLACVSDEPVSDQQRTMLSMMTQHMAIERISPLSSKVRGITALVSGRALTPAMLFRRRLAETVLRWHREQPFDTVVTFCTGMIDYAKLLLEADRARTRQDASLRPRIRHVLDMVDVDSCKWSRYAAETSPPMKWIYAAEARRLRTIEAGRHETFDALTVISRAEAERYRLAVGDHPRLTVVGNGVDLDYFHPLPPGDRRTFVFTGVLNYKPNVDAVLWFARDVMPALRMRVRGARLLVVGRDPGPQIKELDGRAGVEVIGAVPDVRPMLAQAAAAVAPLRIAPGVQNKVLEAMACARPVVCSPAAARGIDAVPGRDLLLADDPADYVSQLEMLALDPERAAQIGESARRCVEQTYAWPARLAPMIDLVRGDSQPQPLRRAA
jgi:sugar transferase (PEP-CTERM/EpsH1 system associated)